MSGAAPVRGRRRSTGRARRTDHRHVLLGYVAVFLATVAVFGADRTLGAIAAVLNVIFLLYLLRRLAFAVAAARWVERDLDAPAVGAQSFTPSVAVLVACRDEEAVIDGMVSQLLALDYPASALSVVVVDDASTDGTRARLDAWATADRRVHVLHRAPDSGGGTPGALNDGLTMVEADLVVALDAGHRLEGTVVRQLVRHFRDPSVGAVTGRRVQRDGAGRSPVSLVAVDHLTGDLVDGYGRQALFELPGHGGVCAVRTDVVRSIGGWDPHAGTRDTDLTLRVLRGGRRVRYDPSAVDAEQAAPTVRHVWRQRYDRARGQQKCLRDHWRPVLRSRHLSPAQKAETTLALLTHHLPMLCGLGLLLSCLRAFGLGAQPAWGLLPLSALLLAGPLTELTVGLVHGRTQRHAGWMLLGFVPAVGMSIVTATAAYVDGMWGRAHRRTRVTRSRAASTLPVRSSAGVAVRDAASLTFARREVVALSALNERIDATPNPASAPDPDRIEVQR